MPQPLQHHAADSERHCVSITPISIVQPAIWERSAARQIRSSKIRAISNRTFARWHSRLIAIRGYAGRFYVLTPRPQTRVFSAGPKGPCHVQACAFVHQPARMHLSCLSSPCPCPCPCPCLFPCTCRCRVMQPCLRQFGNARAFSHACSMVCMCLFRWPSKAAGSKVHSGMPLRPHPTARDHFHERRGHGT